MGEHECCQQSADTAKFEGIEFGTLRMGRKENLGQDQYSSKN